MKGADIQLYAKNRINSHIITGKPNCNTFISVYRKMNNFSIDTFEIESNSNVDYGKTLSFYIPKNGHYIHQMFLKIKLPELEIPSGSTYVSWCNSIGHAIIDNIDFSIGEFVISEHDGFYMEIDDELYQNTSTNGKNQLIGKYTSNASLIDSDTDKYIYVPLKFWFNTDLSKSIPLFLLKFHELKVNIKLRSFDEIVVFDGLTQPSFKNIESVTLLTEYIFIEKQEIEYQLQNGPEYIEYIIPQIQRIKFPINFNSNQIVNVPLNDFNYPSSELIVTFIETDSILNNDYFNFSKRNLIPDSKLIPIVKSIKMLIDGNERYKEQNESVYRLVYNYMVHPNVPTKHIYTIPFAQNPSNENCYSGTLNFSAIDDPVLIFQANSNINESTLMVYSRAYNVFFINKGMAGVKYNS